MTDPIMSDYSFNPISTDDYITPKIFYDHLPLGAEGDGGNTIELHSEALPQGDSIPRDPSPINHKDINSLWHSGGYYNDDEPFRTDRLTNLKEIQQYYLSPDEVPLDVPLPPYDPSNTITLNTMEGIRDQWSTFMSKTGDRK